MLCLDGRAALPVSWSHFCPSKSLWTRTRHFTFPGLCKVMALWVQTELIKWSNSKYFSLCQSYSFCVKCSILPLEMESSQTLCKQIWCGLFQENIIYKNRLWARFGVEITVCWSLEHRNHLEHLLKCRVQGFSNHLLLQSIWSSWSSSR
jgi:hypothetical protein